MPKTTALTGPSNSSSDLAGIASDAAEKGMVEYLKDVEYAEALVQWLHDETNISKTALRIAVKLFAQLVAQAASGAGALAGTAFLKVLERTYDALPGTNRITAAIRSVIERFSREQMALGEFTRWLDEHRTTDPDDLRQYLTVELQAARESLERLEEIIDLLQPQPHLDIPLERDTRDNRFLFAARKVEFVGRERHLAVLDEFLSSGESFTWWLAAGPGGTGKSRLALEMCLRLGAGWRIGFLRGHHSFAWETWQPNQATALVVDYANEEAKRVGEMIGVLRGRADNGELRCRVRVLLLVRDAEGEWRQRFLEGQVNRPRIERARYAEPLMVDPLSDDDLWTVLRSFVSDGGRLPEREETLRRLLEIDPLRRPLFASFAGDAINNGHDLRGWDQDALVRDILDQ